MYVTKEEIQSNNCTARWRQPSVVIKNQSLTFWSVAEKYQQSLKIIGKAKFDLFVIVKRHLKNGQNWTIPMFPSSTFSRLAQTPGNGPSL